VGFFVVVYAVETVVTAVVVVAVPVWWSSAEWTSSTAIVTPARNATGAA
jgi:hypothetical protein